MSVRNVENDFLFAVRKSRKKRSNRELDVIFSTLRRLDTLQNLREPNLRALCPLVRYEFHPANKVLFNKDDQCNCWYILMSGAVYIQGSMFLPHQCFGKQIPGSKRRGYQCVVLEPSEMIAVDYPEMAIHSSGEGKRPHAMRRTTSLENALNNGADVETSSSENSPLRQLRRVHSNQTPNDQAVVVVTDNDSQYSKDMDDDEFHVRDPDEEDSISLHSNSSFFIKDLVIEVLKKEIDDRKDDDLEILMEFTKSLRAFSNMTEPIRRSLCKKMVFAWVEHADTVVLRDNELLDSWSVIINGQVQNKTENDEQILGMGDSFGVKPTQQAQRQIGTMITLCDDCQFFLIAQQDFFDVLHQGQENIENIVNEEGEVVMVKEKREFEHGAKKGNIAIRGTAQLLMKHMLEENAVDTTYIEDFLLTYRVFDNDPLKMCTQLLEWFDVQMFRDRVIRIILLWVNNHFKDFESNWKMMALLEKFHEKLHQLNLQGQTKLFNIACSTKAKPRVVTINRSSDDGFGFEIIGGSDKLDRYPIYVSTVTTGSHAETKGIKRGDQLLEVNGQNFEKLSTEKARAILKKNTDLSLTLKTNLFDGDEFVVTAFPRSQTPRHFDLLQAHVFHKKDLRTSKAFKELMSDLENPTPKVHKISSPLTLLPQRIPITSTSSEGDGFETSSKHKKGGTLGRARGKLSRMFKKEGNTFTDFMALHAESLGYEDQGYATIDGPKTKRNSSTLSLSTPDLVDVSTFDYLSTFAEAPNDVIKVYRADQSFRFIFVSKDTTAGDAVRSACKEFAVTDNAKDYALYRVTVQGENFVKQSKLPDPWSKLTDIPLGARYYLKNTMTSEQLLPDENIPDLLKEVNFAFLDLNSYEIALNLTREDYKLFQLTEPSNFIDDLFNRGTELQKYKDFEDLVNRELFWVVTTICSEPNVVQRAKIIKHFIKMAHHCKSLKNFNSTFALVSGLGYRAVSRLKQTWEKVPARSVRLFEELQALMDPSRNMSKYRTLLSESIHQPPVIPYIPVVKKDLTFLHLGNDTKVDGLVNFEKMRMLSKEVRNVSRLCVPDVSQIIPLDVGSQKDNDKAIYQTLVRKGRRGSFNNARRMYEDKINMRKVRQHMQNISVLTDEEKLMEMSKITESQAAFSSTLQKRRHTSANLLGGESPSRPPKPPSALLTRNDSTGSTNSAQSRNTLESQFTQNVESSSQQQTKKKSPMSTLPEYSIDPNSPKLIQQKLIMLSEVREQHGRLKKSKEMKRSASEGGHDSSPDMNRKQLALLKEVENNNVIGFENLNLNNNRRELGSANSCTSLDSVIESLSEADKKSISTNSSSSGVSSGRGSIISSTSLGTAFTSNPSIASFGAGSSPCSSPVSWDPGSSHCNTAPANLLTLQQKSPASPSRLSSVSSTDTIKSGGNRRSYRELPVIKQPKNGRSSSYGGGGMMPLNRGERILSQISASSPALSANDSHSLILPNHPRISKHPSTDSGIVTTGSVSADATRTSEEMYNGQNYSHPPNAPPLMRRSLPPLPKDQTDSSSRDNQLKEGVLRLAHTQHTRVDSNDANKLSKTAVKNIHDFERYAAVQNRLARPLSITSNPVMEPNYTPSMCATDTMSEEQLVLQLQRQQLGNIARSRNSNYINWPMRNDETAPPGHTNALPGSDKYVYENHVIAQKEYEERRKKSPQQNTYINLPYQQPSLPTPPTRTVQRQQAIEQQWNPDLSSVPPHTGTPEKVYANAEIINQQLPPPPPKRTTSIGRPRLLRLSVDSSTGNSPLTSPTSPSQIISPTSPRTHGSEFGSPTNNQLQHPSNIYSGLPSSGSGDPRSLPSYGNAIRQIGGKQDSAANTKNYNPYVVEPGEKSGRVSRV